MQDFLDIRDLAADTLTALIAAARGLKAARDGLPRGMPDSAPALPGRRLLMLFEKPSTRTRLSFDLAMRQLGGDALDLEGGKLQLGRGETIEDTGRVLSLFGDAVVFRGHDHAALEALAEAATVPVINGLTNHSHPCQALADAMTVIEEFGTLEGVKVAYLGDANNVARSLMEVVAALGGRIAVAAPAALGFDADFAAFAAEHAGAVDLVHDPAAALADARVVYTDTWHSMGLEHGAGAERHFLPFRVDEKAMARAAADAIFLHCLPAHRGEEVVDAVIDGPASRVWRQAENRLHVQKAILIWCLGGGQALAELPAAPERDHRGRR